MVRVLKRLYYYLVLLTIIVCSEVVFEWHRDDPVSWCLQ